MIESTLKQLNLTDKEIQMYLTLLQLGQSTINRVSELTNSPKSTCYDILRSLISRGLVASFDKDKVKHFEAADPRVFISRLDEQKQRVKEILPELLEMRKSIGSKPMVEMYEGKIGIKSIFDKVIETKKEYLVFGNYPNFLDVFKWFLAQFRRSRAKAGVNMRMISDTSKIAQEIKKSDKQEKRVCKMDPLMDNQKAEAYVFGDNVSFVTLSEKEPVGILIENKEIANLMRDVFERIWKSKHSVE